jgi:tetratricopeptide (TPR) repeat protein
MIPYDEKHLMEQLERLPPERRVAFAAACAERLAPTYATYSARTGRGDPAKLESLLEALAREPGSPDVRYRRAIFFLRREQLDDAEREIAAAFAARPEEPRYLLARLFLHEARAKAPGFPARERIPEDLVDHLARTATSPSQLCETADFEGMRGRIDGGLRLVERALGIDPLTWACHEVRARLLAEAARFDEALAAMDRAMALLPERAPIEKLVAARRAIELKRSRAPASRPAP